MQLLEPWLGGGGGGVTWAHRAVLSTRRKRGEGPVSLGGVSSHFKSAHKSTGAGEGGRRRPCRNLSLTQEELFSPPSFLSVPFLVLFEPRTGWGSSLCCWLGWDTARYGDDCASYCLASAGAALQRRKRTTKVPLPALLAGSPGKKKRVEPHRIFDYL